jgi:beta-fructofuranosidase
MGFCVACYYKNSFDGKGVSWLKNQHNSWLEQAPHKRQQLASDPHRPRFHFLPPGNWMNDPNGLIHWQGQYHMFYQHNPNHPFWGDIHWGHAVSSDLVHWRDLEPALTPDMPPVDDGGCWSGCTVNDNGVPTLLYTGVKDGEQTTCIATSDNNLLVWQKDKANPVLKAPQRPGFQSKNYRDPYVWREGDVWYQVISMTIHGRGQVLLYCSSDLKSWQYLHPLITDEVRQTISDEADIWECPNFFALEDKWVLIVSIWKNHALLYPFAMIGDFKDLRFYPEQQQRIDWGEKCFYAPLTFKDEQGRRLMFGWLQEQRSREEQVRAGWSGVMSLPRVLSIENGKLKTDFAPELQALRQEKVELSDVTLNESRVLEHVNSDRLELQLSLYRHSATRSGVVFKHSSDEQTVITIDWVKNEVWLESANGSYKSPFDALGNTIDLHIFVDGSVLEVLVNREAVITCRVYPQHTGGAVELYSEGGESRVETLTAWSLNAVWT